MSEEVDLDVFNCSVSHTPHNVTIMRPFMPFNSASRGHNFNAKLAWKGAIQGIRALQRVRGASQTAPLRPELVVITGHEQGHIQVRNVDQGIILQSAVHYNHVRVTDLVVTNSYIYTIVEKDLLKGRDGHDVDVYCWDLLTLTIAHTLEGHEQRVTCITVSPVKETICVTGSIDRSIIVWDILAQQKLRHRFFGHTLMVIKLVMLDEGRTLVSGSADGTLRVWDLTEGEQSTGSCLGVYDGHPGPIVYLAWEMSEARRPVTLNVAPDQPGALSSAGEATAPSSPTNSTHPVSLISGCGMGTVREWAYSQLTRTLKLHWNGKSHNGVVLDICDDRPLIMSCGSDNVLTIHHRNLNSYVRISRPETVGIRVLELDLIRKYLLAGTETGQLMIWDYSYLLKSTRNSGFLREDDMQLLITLAPHTASITSLLLERDMKGKWERIITTSHDGTVVVLDYDLERNRTIVDAPQRYSIQLTTGTIFSASDEYVYLTDPRTMAPRMNPNNELPKHNNLITGVAYSSDDQRIVTVSLDGTAKVWEVVLYTEEDRKDDEVIRPIHVESYPFPLHGISEVTGGLCIVFGTKSNRSGVIATLDIASNTEPQALREFTIPIVPKFVALPNENEVLIQYRAGEVLCYRNEGGPSGEGQLITSIAPRDNAGPPPEGISLDVFPVMRWVVETNWNPHHTVVFVAEGRSIRLVDLKTSTIRWVFNADSWIVTVELFTHGHFSCVLGTAGSSAILLDRKGQAVAEILEDGGTVHLDSNSNMLFSPSNYTMRRRRSFNNTRLIQEVVSVASIAVHSKARMMAIAFVSGVMILYDTSMRRTVRRIRMAHIPRCVYLYPEFKVCCTEFNEYVQFDKIYPRVTVSDSLSNSISTIMSSPSSVWSSPLLLRTPT